jgi:hypothetical protein
MKGYQLKLDFGEGQECHKLYEEFLQETKTEDTPEQWGMFVTCYQVIESMKVMEESKRHTLQ